ncbi:uncharacterized protein BN535_03096 [Bacteroides caccae CAG:21]|nr:uncharacterized protein BN535_03096 [Bacteroides caccae CAG:21]
MKQEKLILLFLLCLLSDTLCAKVQTDELCRQSINFNRNWKYMQGDYTGAERTDYDDSSWETIGIPHSFSIPYFMSKDFYTGYGWYRKSFELTAKDLKQQLFVEFDGVFQEAEVFVNGKKAGTHTGGYTGFYFDISSAVHMGNNVIAVRVNNIWKANVAPRAGEHVFSGGIYRNVRLVRKSPVHIDWYGIFATTPDLAAHQGKSSVVRVCTDICNKTNKTMEFKLLTEVKDAEGRILVSVENEEKVEANSMKKLEQITEAVNHPTLWHPRHPYLYKVVSSVYQGQMLIDRVETPFGFRWFEWTADKGFFLNGEHLFFKGVNVHQDQAGWGDAVTEAAMRRDILLMKEAGFDLIRGSHYPHAPAFSQACDEEGMLFWSEAPFWGIGGFRPDGYWDSSAYPVDKKDAQAFEASALQQLEEMIRIHRNHPSIVAWSMCNEAFFSAPEAMKGVRRLLKRMVDLTHQLDPSRPAAIGGAQRPLGDERIDKIGDIGGYNGDGATQPDFQNPSIPNVVSEYGSVTAERPGEYNPGWGDLQMNDGWKGTPWRSGQAIWCGFDHGSIAGSQLGKMGIVDYFRIPKRSWYWYRNEYTRVAPPEWAGEGVPAQLRLEASRTDNILTDGTDDVQLMVTVLNAAGKPVSNSPAVELRLVSGPGEFPTGDMEFPTGNMIRFKPDSDIRIMDGKAAIAFRSYYAGTSVLEATSPGLKPARIEIVFQGNEAYKKGLTPEVRERSYVRFVREKKEKAVQEFGRNNPTFSSSHHENQVAGFAADGNLQTYWQASKDDPAPFWILDTEKELELKNIQVRFPKKSIYRYVLEVSGDKVHWTVVSDKQANRRKESHIAVDFPDAGVRARFVRIRFVKKSPAVIAEVTVRGIVCE